MEPQRVLVLWCPDWPVTAATRAAGLSADSAVALVEKGMVLASSRAARAEGVRRGLRLREAQARCSTLVVFDYDPALDNRSFEPIIAGIEQLVPGVQVVRPGVCAVRIRGAARYYGGELPAALALAGRADDEGAGGARIGIADGIFTAEQAARSTVQSHPGQSHPVQDGTGQGGTGQGDTVRIVPAGESAAFLAPLGVGLLAQQEPGRESTPGQGAASRAARSAGRPAPEGIVTLLRRLGITTLGQFASLPFSDVATRFGDDGARLHTLASGRDSWPISPRTPPRDLDIEIAFEPAVDRVDQVAFGVRTSAERFIDGLTAAKLVCTAIRVELGSDSGELSERVWLHPRSFSPGDVVDRVRWQLQGTGVIDAELSSGIISVRISPDAVDPIGNHETGLWGTAPDERIHHGLSRVQSMLGHGAVLMPGIGGGRTLTDRQELVAWGDRPVGARPAEQPWPGRLPAPLPGTVFSPRHPVHVFAADGASVSVDDRGILSAAPARFSATSTRLLQLTAWAGPWPLDERWWSEDARSAWRFQAVDETGCAWLLVLDAGGWWAEGRYD